MSDDDTGARVVAGTVRRVVSLVPSLTEAIAVSAPGLLVGATDYCSHPADLDVPRVGGSKYPDLAEVRKLRPDLVIANKEENQKKDVEALRADGIPVWVTSPVTVAEALVSLGRMLAACGLSAPPDWLVEARRIWTPPGEPTRTAAVPIWRRPWMVLGPRTFAGDVLRHLGIANAYEWAEDRYPRVSADDIRGSGAELIVLPDEPYAFSPEDGPEEFPGLPCAFVSGRHLTWYGPSLVEARELLEAQIARASG